MPRSKLDVAVVGAGVIGLAIARELTRDRRRRERVALADATQGNSGHVRGGFAASFAHKLVGNWGRCSRASRRECEIADGKVAGIAVHTGARVAALANPGEVLVSSTVKDLVAGSGIEFIERGAHQLKGIPGEWRLFALHTVSTSGEQ